MTEKIAHFMSLVVPLAILLFGPKDAIMVQIWRRQPLRTWHYETLSVAAILVAVVLISGNKSSEWVGFAALMLAHGRNSVMFRLAEAQAAPTVGGQHVDCYPWARTYFLASEAFWAYYFIDHKAWAALAGVGIFVGFERWRSWYQKQRNKRPSQEDRPLCTGCEWCTNCRARKNWPPA